MALPFSPPVLTGKGRGRRGAAAFPSWPGSSRPSTSLRPRHRRSRRSTTWMTGTSPVMTAFGPTRSGWAGGFSPAARNFQRRAVDRSTTPALRAPRSGVQTHPRSRVGVPFIGAAQHSQPDAKPGRHHPPRFTQTAQLPSRRLRLFKLASQYTKIATRRPSASGSNIEMSIAALHGSGAPTRRAVHPKREPVEIGFRSEDAKRPIVMAFVETPLFVGRRLPHASASRPGGRRREGRPRRHACAANCFAGQNGSARHPDTSVAGREQLLSIAPGGVRDFEPDVMDLGDDQRRHYRSQISAHPAAKAESEFSDSGSAPRASAHGRGMNVHIRRDRQRRPMRRR